MLPLWVVVVLVVAAIVALLYQGAAIVLAYQMPKLRPTTSRRTERVWPTVSVIIAARNEEDALPSTLDTLLAQEYPNLEIVVVEDGSTDRTREVILARAPRVRCVDPPPLPPGWTGKNWACWTGVAATHGEWLLFLDADVRTHALAIRDTMEWALDERADLASLATRVETVGIWERVVLPYFVQLTLLLFRASHVNRDDSKTAMANGQFWMTPRATYQELGGHAVVKGIVQEDVALARHYRAAGRRLRIAYAPELAVTRMYRDRHEMFEGLLKNLTGPDHTPARLTADIAGVVGFYLLPLGLLPFAVYAGNLALIGIGAFLYVALFGKHFAFSRSLGTPGRYGLLYPVAAGFFVALFATAISRHARGLPMQWKGRAYPSHE
jgi:glycosyltransferase involved in cell wall biosynthesis